MPAASRHPQIDTLIAAHAHRPGALLPLLHAIQDACGHIPPQAIAPIASALNLSQAEVHGVISFYRHFRSTPPARHTVHLCCGEACQSMGAEALAGHARARVEQLAPGECDLQPVYCLGLCATSPAVQVDDALHARVTPERFDALIEAMRSLK